VRFTSSPIKLLILFHSIFSFFLPLSLLCFFSSSLFVVFSSFLFPFFFLSCPLHAAIYSRENPTIRPPECLMQGAAAENSMQGAPVNSMPGTPEQCMLTPVNVVQGTPD
jgi:hypothetical protein